MKIKSILLTSIISSGITLLLLLAFFAIVSPTAASPAFSLSANQSGSLSNPGLLESGLFDPDGPIQMLTAPEPEDMAATATHYLHISGSDFNPLYFDEAPMYDSGGCIYSSAATPNHAYFNYSLAMPYQSTITQMRIYYKDTNAAINLSARLRQMDDGIGFTDIGPALSSTGSAGLGAATVDINYMIDYVNFSYVVQVTMNDTGNDMEFCGVRIAYIAPSIFGVALPFVTK
jgi:hypothetical protein